jgi:RHS repeat-associated protein
MAEAQCHQQGEAGALPMPSPNKEVLCTYHYDPLDRLIGLNPAKQDTVQRFYCKSRLATEIQGVARCAIMQQGDQLLAQQKRSGDTLETALLATDQQRSVMHTVGINSLAIAYSPYGHLRAESGLTSLLGFNGERPDALTGHYLLGSYRVFDLVLMRFISPDSLSPFGKGGLNSYAYCLGDPVNWNDPTGNTPWFLLATKKLAETKLVFKVLADAKHFPPYSVRSGGLFQGLEKHLISPNSSAGKQLSKWRAPPRTPEVIAASKPYEKLNFFSENPTMKAYKQRLNSELKAYGFDSVMTNKTMDRLRHHNSKQRLVIDDLQSAFRNLHDHNKVVGFEPVETISPFYARLNSNARAKEIRER